MVSAPLTSFQSQQSDNEEKQQAIRRARFGLPDTNGPSAKAGSKQDRMQIGFNVLTEEQAAMRQARANRFHTEDSLVKGGAHLSKTTDYSGTGRQNYSEAMELSEEDMLAERRQSAIEAERRPDVVHLYGVRLLSIPEVLQYFARFGPTTAKWTHRDSCNVAFADPESATDAVLSQGTLMPPEEAPDNIGLTEADVKEVAFLWHRGLGAHSSRENKMTDPICFRIATVNDKETQQQVQQGSQNRQNAAHRGKGKRKTSYQDMDAVGQDVKMKSRGERGGRRYQEKKRKRLLGEDTEMMAAEDLESAEHQPTNAEVRGAAAMGDEAAYHRAHGPDTMFSGEAAGARVRPGALYPPRPTQLQNKMLDYGDI